MARFTSFVIFILLMMQSTFTQADENRSMLLTYDILSQGKDIGDLTTRISQQGNRHVIIEWSHIKASGWLWKIDIVTILSEEFENGNKLTNSDGKTFEEGSAHWTKIGSQEKDILMQYLEIPKPGPREEKQIARLSLEAEANTSSNTEDILSLSGSIFMNIVEGVQEFSVSRKSFDTTWNNLPFYIQRKSDSSMPLELKILDTENLEIGKFTVKDVGRETLMLAKEPITVRHLTFSNRKTGTSHIWINTDSGVLPHVVRHTGKDEDGAFEIVLKSTL